MTTIDETLSERGKRYGEYNTHAEITQGFKEFAREYIGWGKLSDSQKEALDMIFHRVGRILNGDPNYTDSWHDIAGYATLVENELSGEIQQ